MFFKKSLFISGTIILIGLVTVSPGLAGEKEDTLVNQLVEAYGGEKLLDLQSFVKEDERNFYVVGQGRRPGDMDENIINYITAYDVVNNMGSQETWISSGAGVFHNIAVFDGEKGYSLNYGTQEYSETPNASLLGTIGGNIRSSAPLLVKELNTQKESAEYLGSEDLDGRKHEVLKFDFPGSPPITLYIDAETNLVTKSIREIPNFGTLEYHFSDYERHEGIVYATSFSLEVDGQTIAKTVGSRGYRFNVPVEEYFKMPENFTNAGENIDTSSLITNRIAEGVYHLGTGTAYSVFVDVGDYIVGAGGYPGLTQRFEEYQIATGSNKPLKFQIVTHHHTDHLGGMPEVADMGASFVTVAENVDSIKAAVTDEIDDSRFYLMSGSKTFGRDDGQRVEVYEISTTHAEQFLLFYVPGEKLIFMADHYGTALKQGIPGGNNNTISLEAAIEELGLDVEKIASAHNPRIMTLDDLKASNQKIPDACYDNRPICS